MKILGIESSCDETAAAVVEDGRMVLSNVVATQHALHEAFAGVVPEIASRAHLERIVPVIRAAMRDAGVSFNDLDAIAVGNRPGLVGSLLVGIAAAKALAWSLTKPLIAVDHVVAHLHAATLNAGPIAPPAIGLVVSGGHTSLFEIGDDGRIALMGRTIDDAVGEAFDKASAILGLGYPGGPAIDARAREGDAQAHDLPVSTLDPGSLDFSFSGLKTALLYAVRGAPRKEGDAVVYDRDAADLSDREKADFAASFQRAAIRAVMVRLERAADRMGSARSLVIGGGVCANSLLRAEAGRFAARRGLVLRLPPPELCVDNAAMIAGRACVEYAAGHSATLALGAHTDSLLTRREGSAASDGIGAL